MTYFKTWQDAFMVFIRTYGDNYVDAYTLTADFEHLLQQNIKGSYYMNLPGEKS